MLHPGQLTMSAITFAELMNGAKKNQHIESNISKLKELAELIEICPFDQNAAVFYGDVRSTLEKKDLGTFFGYSVLHITNLLRIKKLFNFDRIDLASFKLRRAGQECQDF